MQIKVKDVVRTYDKGLKTQFNALDGVSAEINQSDFIGIIGQTGSGKTTFIEHLNALLIPETGHVQYLWKEYNKKKNTEVDVNLIIKKNFRKKVKNAKGIRRRVGVVFQFAEYQLFESTVEKDIIFGAISLGVPKNEAKERAHKYIELVGLDKSFLTSSPLELSGGQKRRVAIAGILSMEPDVLVFDEPTAGLDPVGIKETMEIFGQLNKEGKTIIIVTHDLDNVLEWTKNLIVFDKGKIIYNGPTYELLENTDFLKENNMEPPKILEFKSTLKSKGFNIGRVKTIEELAHEIDLHINGKK